MLSKTGLAFSKGDSHDRASIAFLQPLEGAIRVLQPDVDERHQERRRLSRVRETTKVLESLQRLVSVSCARQNVSLQRDDVVTSSRAVAKGKVVAATADGQVICFG